MRGFLCLGFAIYFQGTILECDQQLAYLHGYASSDELLNMNVNQLIPSLVLPVPGQTIDKVREGERSTLGCGGQMELTPTQPQIWLR